jgi:hypothetical protein
VIVIVIVIVVAVAVAVASPREGLTPPGLLLPSSSPS